MEWKARARQKLREANRQSGRTMASSKKTREDKEKKKTEAKARATKSTKPENKKAKTSSKKPNNDKKTGIGNGYVRESEDEVVTLPASSTDSQEVSDDEQEKRKIEATNERKKHKKPKKSTKKQEDQDDDENGEENIEDAAVCNFPMSRIRRIIKSQSSDFAITGEAVFLVNKATDKFLEQFSEDAYACCSKDRKKSLAYKHLVSVVSKQRRYDFLSDFVPEKIKAEDALAEWKSAEAGEG